MGRLILGRAGKRLFAARGLGGVPRSVRADGCAANREASRDSIVTFTHGTTLDTAASVLNDVELMAASFRFEK